MVRPNQIIRSTEDTLTFIMFAQSKDQVKRRVLLLNFPSKFAGKVIMGKDLDRYIGKVSTATKGLVNRYQVTVNLEEVNDA